MRIEDHFRSLSVELSALRDRVRYMIENSHWPTDGEWKESVLRSVVRRSAPLTHGIARGFVIGPSGNSSQLDILVHDTSHPTIYKDGDLVFVSAAACRAVIEVKSRLTAATFRESCEKLADAAEFIRNEHGGGQCFVGLFAYDVVGIRPSNALDVLANAARLDPRRVIDCIALGESNFIKFWHMTPQPPHRAHDSWHFYDLPQMSAGYFVHNLLMHLSPNVEQDVGGVWFPQSTKEVRMRGERRLSDG